MYFDFEVDESNIMVLHVIINIEVLSFWNELRVY